MSLLLKLRSNSATPIALDVTPDARILCFTELVSLLTATLFGLVPALRATQLNLTPALKESVGSQSGAGQRLGLGRSLVALPVALCLMLLIGAGLFVRSLQELRSFLPGIQP